MKLTAFDRNTALMPDLIAETVIGQTNVSEPQRKWFIAHCNDRMRTCYRLNATFKRRLDRDQTPDTAYKFIEHWYKSFISNPLKYISRCV